MLVQFHVAVVESLIVTTGPCVTRVAYSSSGQPKPQLRGVQSPPQQRNHRGCGVGPVAALHRYLHYVIAALRLRHLVSVGQGQQQGKVSDSVTATPHAHTHTHTLPCQCSFCSGCSRLKSLPFLKQDSDCCHRLMWMLTLGVRNICSSQIQFYVSFLLR